MKVIETCRKFLAIHIYFINSGPQAKGVSLNSLSIYIIYIKGAILFLRGENAYLEITDERIG